MGTKPTVHFYFGGQVISQNAFLARPEIGRYKAHFESVLASRNPPGRHGDLPKWLAIVDDLPNITPSQVFLDQDVVTFGSNDDLSNDQSAQLYRGLHALCPWRKGPYELFGTRIDTEWRSDLKWHRLLPHIADLHGRAVLDVGCGTGYHCWRMLGSGASSVLGVDPSMRFVVQNAAIQKYAQDQRFDFLPLGIEDMPSNMPHFDSVFSMGVLYHRRTPINHLIELRNLMQEGGELILETLIVDHAKGGILKPSDRYAQMRNVWSIMTVEAILELLEQAGFKGARCVDQNVTSLEEQRRTHWMQFHSLKEFLDPQNIGLTIEGYPAPKRGIFITNK
ncbi:MAG: tRNA (mo5U34)-methyltransferase [Cryomorphaceae bacterium]